MNDLLVPRRRKTTASISARRRLAIMTLMIIATAFLSVAETVDKGTNQQATEPTGNQQSEKSRTLAPVFPTLDWSYTTGGYVISTPVVADVDGDGEQEVVIGSWDHKLYSLNSTGGLKWSYTTGGLVQTRSAVADVDADGQQEVIIASEDNRTYCLDGKTGAQEWNYASDGGMIVSGIADIDGNGKLEIVVGSGGSYNVYCLNGSGVQMWNYSMGGGGAYSTIADVNADGKFEVVVGSITGKVYCLNGTGGFLWSCQAGTGISSSPAVSDIDGDGQKEVVVGSWDNRVYCLSSTGTTKWNYTTNAPIWVDTNIADVDGDDHQEVLAGSRDNKVYCLNGTGGLKWSYAALNRVQCMPAVADVDEDGQQEIVFGSIDCRIYCLNGTGGLEGNYVTGGFVEAFQGPAIADVNGDGHLEVVIGSGDWKVYCIFFAPPDITAPATITDLATSSPTDNSIALTWTAPGDDGMTGNASGYIVKYSTSWSINADVWHAATTYTQFWTPVGNGTVETHVLAGLTSATTYWFAVEAYDEQGNYGGVSNSANATTTTGSLPPPPPTPPPTPPLLVVSIVAGVVALVFLVSLVYVRQRRVQTEVPSERTPETVSVEETMEVEETRRRFSASLRSRPRVASVVTPHSCPKCGAKVKALDALFCWSCGASIEPGVEGVLVRRRGKRAAMAGKCMVCNLDVKESHEAAWCPYCGNIAHEAHLLEWLHVKDYCPICGAHLGDPDLGK